MDKVLLFYDLPGPEWIGGINYYRSLFQNLLRRQGLRISIASRGRHTEEYYRTTYCFDQRIGFMDVGIGRLGLSASKVLSRLFNIDLVLLTALRAVKPDFVWLQNFKHLFGRFRCVLWIPDLQHVSHPAFFTVKEARRRDRQFLRASNLYDGVVVSSRHGQTELIEHYPRINPQKVFLFRFHPTFAFIPGGVTHIGVPKKFLYLPNQFWIHKNHLLVLEALDLSRRQIPDIHIVFSGELSDYRHADYIETVKNKLLEQVGNSCATYLGTIAHYDVLCLMSRCQAVLNPSLIEGWSTTVEEGKMLGRTLVLSDIPVHREQCPDAIFFNPRSVQSVSDALLRAWKGRITTFDDSELLARQRDAAVETDRELDLILNGR